MQHRWSHKANINVAILPATRSYFLFLRGLISDRSLEETATTERELLFTGAETMTIS